MATTTEALQDQILQSAHLLHGAAEDYDPLLEQIGDARYVLLGEASHGTHEFYHARAEITKRLIAEKGFNAVAVEADWPDAYRVNCYVRGQSDDASPLESLAGFSRFPTWMWRNTDVQEFIGWLREWNDARPSGAAGFYGIDLYSLAGSMEAVLAYLDKVDPEAAGRARDRYACFDHFSENTQAYGYAATMGMTPSCEEEVMRQLRELQHKAADYASRDGRVAADKYFYAEQNARLVQNAEKYYRSMFGGRTTSWNLRDTHMADSLNALVDHLGRSGEPARVVVWAHNSHLGDARATDMGRRGELNLGQLVRERHGEEAFAVGFTTYSGTVTAASNWDEPAERKHVRPGLPGSYEELLHHVGAGTFHVPLCGALLEALSQPRLERAIGVIYRPETERYSHYFEARLAQQFDAVLHFDNSRAVEPLEPSGHWHRGEEEPPETYPSGV